MALTQVSTGGIKNATIKNEDIEADTVQLTKLQNMATNHILGRSTSGTGNPEVLSAASVRSILNVTDGATFSNINGNVDNRVLTATGTTGVSQGEANLTFDGSKLAISNTSSTDANNTVNGVGFTSGTFHHRSKGNNAGISGQTYSNQLISSNGTNVALELYTIGGTGTPIVFGTDSTERMRVDTSGNVGIGTTSPTQKLAVDGNIILPDVGTVHFGVSDTAYVRGKDSTDGYIKLGTAGTDRVHVDHTGKVGIGTTSPSTTLSVINDSNTEGFNVKHSNLTQGVGIGYDHVKSTGSSTNVPLHLRAKGSGGVRIGYDSTNKVRIDSDGLKFNSDTAAANALDDYEEGTFTLGASAMGVTNTNCKYVKIGRLVHCTGELDNGSSGNGALVAQFSGLPFAGQSGTEAGGQGGTIPSHNFGVTVFTQLVSNSSMRVVNDTGSHVTQSVVDDKNMKFNITYYTT